MRAIDVQGFGGAFALGARQAGFDLVAKLEDTGSFGTPVITSNQHLYGMPETIEGKSNWVPFDAEIVISNPPCAAFSLINTSKGSNGRGMHSDINSCMWATFEYAAKVKPLVVIMESVQQAYTQGSDLMRALVQQLRDDTGLDYKLTHVLQDNLSCGGGTRRPRYFLVASQVPFWVTVQAPLYVPALHDVISDLLSLPLQWEPQEIPNGGSWYSYQFHTPSHYTDGHIMHENLHNERMMSLVRGDDGVKWDAGERDLDVLRKYYDANAKLPGEWDYRSLTRDADGTRVPKSEILIKAQFERKGFSGVIGWDPTRPGRVLTGAGPGQIFNVLAQRMFTFRECARLMGFPDSLMIAPMRDVKLMHAFWGKQTSVHPARWICQAAHQSILGMVTEDLPVTQGDLDSHGDRVINITHLWKPVWDAQVRAASL